jgi:site-specific recombinase
MFKGIGELIRRWRSADRAQLQLDALIAAADPHAPLDERNAWLIELGYWWRAEDALSERLRLRVPRRVVRLRYFLQVLERDGVMLLCDTGLAQNASFWSELRERSIQKLIPKTPTTREWGSLLSQLFPARRDALWLETIDEKTWLHLSRLFERAPASGHALNDLRHSIRFLLSQVRATALSSAIRSRMTENEFAQSPYLPLESRYEAVLAAFDEAAQDPAGGSHRLAQELNLFRALLSHCDAAVRAVFEHFDAYGVSVDIEYRVEGILARLARIDLLLQLLIDDEANRRRQLMIELLRAHQSSQSVTKLFRQSLGRLARKVVDRSAETGEHYITRTWVEYRNMFLAAAGGGALTGFTVYMKFFITGWHLPRLFEGLLSSMNYAISFVVLQLLGLTLATKQPAMTAPALAARIDRLGQPDGMAAFVEETLNLLRSQSVSVFGNVLLVIPVCWAAEWAVRQFFHVDLITPEKASATIASFSLLGPTPLFAILTGVLLWMSSLIAGWADNWFVYRRLGDVISHHRRTRLLLGAPRAMRFAQYMRTHVSGFAGNISLGFLLGMTPFVGSLLALPIEVRHVTLSAGGLSSAVAVLGFAACSTPGFWLAVAGIISMAILNVGVSFILAFQLALRSRALPRRERNAIYRALLNVLLRRPQTVLLMPRGLTVEPDL